MKSFRIDLTLKSRSSSYLSNTKCWCGNDNFILNRRIRPRSFTEIVEWACMKCGNLMREQIYQTLDSKHNIMNYEILIKKISKKRLNYLKIKHNKELEKAEKSGEI